MSNTYPPCGLHINSVGDGEACFFGGFSPCARSFLLPQPVVPSAYESNDITELMTLVRYMCGKPVSLKVGLIGTSVATLIYEVVALVLQIMLELQELCGEPSEGDVLSRCLGGACDTLTTVGGAQLALLWGPWSFRCIVTPSTVTTGDVLSLSGEVDEVGALPNFEALFAKEFGGLLISVEVACPGSCKRSLTS
jgi:hypothetical protein